MEQISLNADVSITTVKETIDLLKKTDFLRLKIESVYMINPDIITIKNIDERLELRKEYADL